MTNTTNLNLELHNRGVDLNRSFESYRMGLNGDVVSNMLKIDTFSLTLGILLSSLTSQVSGSHLTVDTFISNASGSVVDLTSDIDEIDTRFEKLDEFSSTGQADFNSISQDFTHLLIFGVASINSAVSFADVGCDFNADTNTANYEAVEWKRSGSPISASAIFDDYAIGQIILGNAAGSSDTGYGGGFISIIPNYSVNGGLYKTALGYSANYFEDWMSVSKPGGCWLSTSPITRIRIFGSNKTSTRLNFLSGTTISLYGLL
jgi:hypothetical protein